MKTPIAMINLAVLLTCLTLPAQEPPPPTGGLAARFRQLDRDGDGRLSPRELPNAERFGRMDANGDGFVTLEEAVRSFAQGGGAGGGQSQPVTRREPEAHPPADRAFLDFRFTSDYFAGAQPPGSALAKATEANALVPHDGKLYCAASYMPESGRLADLNPKVLVKKSATGHWEVDLEAGPEFVRLGFLKSVAFTTDGRGNRLPKPAPVLIAGTGAWRAQPTGVVVFSRNDSTGKWTKSVLSPNRWNRENTNHTTEVRCIFDHVDRVTGMHYVFAGSGTGRLFRGVYDPQQPGLIRWDQKPELDGLVGHFLCAAEANGVQYVGVAYGPTKEDELQPRERPVKDHGLFRRVDGPNARWEWAPIKEWEDPNQPGRSLRTAQLRGMTAIPAPDGNGEVLLYAWDSRDAVIERIDPRASFKMTAELDVRDYFQKAWGRRVGIGTFAYNDMLPVTHPDTGEKAHLIGLWLVDPNGEGNEIGRSSWYLVRYPDGTYRYQRIWDGKNPLTDARYGLRGCRSIRPSPFPEEAGRVWYFSGFDQTGAPGGPGARGATAWVYKGTLPATPGPAARPSASSPPVSAPANVARGPASTRPAEMDANYPQFRGPRGDGVAYGTNLPVTWSTTNNVVWSCPIPGKGWSSPVVWGNRVFVTSAAGPGKVEPPPQPRGLAAHVRGVTSAEEQQYMVLCVDWSTGKPLWSRCVHKGVPPRPIHPKNSYATETPATDGERVYAYFGNIGLFCCDMEGRELWSRRWGDFDMNWNWGPAASPVLHGDLVLVLNDNKERSFLAALDKRTGKDVWRVDRDEKSNWTTPFVWRNDVRVEIVTSGSAKVRSYGLDGKALWELRGMSGVTVPTPFAADGLLYVASGCAHSPQRPVYAIRPGASGDITLKAEAANSEFIAWRQRLAAPYVPSPLVYDKLLYVLLDHGSLAAFDARTGQEVYGPQRLAAGRASFSASPWAYDGRLFCLSDTGETHVVRAGPEFRVLHVNRLEEAAYATPAVARDSLIFRTLTRLYRIAHTTEGKRP